MDTDFGEQIPLNLIVDPSEIIITKAKWLEGKPLVKQWVELEEG